MNPTESFHEVTQAASTLPKRSQRGVYEVNGEVAHLLACYGFTAPPHLGTELYDSTVRRLQHGNLSIGLAPELFRQRLMSAARWLEDNGSSSVRNAEVWLRGFYDVSLQDLYDDADRLAS